MADELDTSAQPDELVNQSLGEVVVAVLGIEALLDGKLRPLTQEQREQILRFPQLLRASVHGIIAGRKVRKAYRDSSFNFKFASKLLAARGDVTAKALLAALPHDVVQPTGLVLARLVDLLQDKLPRRIRTSNAGLTQDVDPGSPTELQDYQTLWDVANDPLIILHHLAEHNVSYDEVAALETLFPSLYLLMKTAVMQACTKIKAARPRWDLDDQAIGPSVAKFLQTQDHSFGAMVTAAFSPDAGQSTGPKPRTLQARPVPLATAAQDLGQ